MKFNNVLNLVWGNKEKTIINCDVEFVDIGTVPFSANITDPYSHSIKIFEECKSGKYGDISEFIPPIIVEPVIVENILTSITKITMVQFLNKFSVVSQLAIVKAAMEIVEIKLWYDCLLASNEVNFADSKLIDGLYFLVSKKIITQEEYENTVPVNLRSNVI